MSPIKSTRSEILRSAHVDPSIGVNPDRLRGIYALPSYSVADDLRDDIYQETALGVLELRARGKTALSPKFIALNARDRVRLSNGQTASGNTGRPREIRRVEVTCSDTLEITTDTVFTRDLERHDSAREAFRLMLKRLRDPNTRALLELALETGDIDVISTGPSNVFRDEALKLRDFARRDRRLCRAAQEVLHG